MQEGSQKTVGAAVNSYNRNELEEAVEQKANSLGMPYFDVRNSEFLPDTLSLVSEEEAKQGFLPLLKKGQKLILGVTNPGSPKAAELKEYFSKFFEVELALISWGAIKDALPHYEGLKKQVLKPQEDYEISAIEGALTFKDFVTQINTAPLQDILKFIVTMAIDSKTSDIHLEPQKDGARLRFRIDGVLHVVGMINAERFRYILSQIELASGMKLNVNESQEGRLEVKITNKNISVRVETMPTLYGDDISLRIFNTEAIMLSVDDLGLLDYDKKILADSLVRPQGMILVVGPTGAGKTSTIYAVLNNLNKPEVKIITLEDPIEYALPGVTQSQVEEGENFTERLMSVLREDPDIVMVGEIRDAETADVALHASLTGHLMISTFHANDTVTAIGLLKEISTSKTLLASSLNLLIAQRLVRRLCDKCKKEYEPQGIEKEFADKIWSSIPASVKKEAVPKFYQPVGCEACNNLGYKGRIGIFELLPLNIELQKVVSREDMTVADLKEAAEKSGMVTMEQDGLIKATQGITNITEVMKAVKE